MSNWLRSIFADAGAIGEMFVYLWKNLTMVVDSCRCATCYDRDLLDICDGYWSWPVYLHIVLKLFMEPHPWISQLFDCDCLLLKISKVFEPLNQLLLLFGGHRLFYGWRHEQFIVTLNGLHFPLL